MDKITIKNKLPRVYGILLEYYPTDVVLDMMEGIDIDNCDDSFGWLESVCIESSFDWEETTQGHMFWREVADKIKAYELRVGLRQILEV